ncbi:hypothetical protein HWV23_05210 [Natronomonas halophila]|uniref:DUF7546 family protein n=1 Tax=Natronomonas halophila TaxID=2747817 RepID=UPI0015B6F4F9|nr:hypothetical protein [Natronomonas halophila]QLD85145.1 hypothetical protein HWV23_05210 [Natronomonas halophila]
MATVSLGRRLPARRLGWGALLLNLQLVSIVAYYTLTTAEPTELRYALYGLLWVNLGAVAIYATDPPEGPDFATRRRAAALAAAYFGVLAVFGGVISTGLGDAASGVRIAWLPPGWGPAFVYAGEYVVIAAMPAFLVGYAALAYLVYVTVLEASGSAVAGLLGLFSCVSCTWPILASIGTSLVGGAGILGAAALNASYDLSTAVFVLTLGLLYWRPGIR